MWLEIGTSASWRRPVLRQTMHHLLMLKPPRYLCHYVGIHHILYGWLYWSMGGQHGWDLIWTWIQLEVWEEFRVISPALTLLNWTRRREMNKMAKNKIVLQCTVGPLPLILSIWLFRSCRRCMKPVNQWRLPGFTGWHTQSTNLDIYSVYYTRWYKANTHTHTHAHTHIQIQTQKQTYYWRARS